MTGLELLRASTTTAAEIAEIIAEQCPPVALPECDGLSCRGCWISWLTTGEPPKGNAPENESVEHLDLTRLRQFLREIDDYVGCVKREGPSDEGTAQAELERLKLLLREVDDYINESSLDCT